MKIKVLALLCAVWVAAIPPLALAQSPNTQGNDGSPTAGGGIRILGSDGTNDYKLLLDSSGRLDTKAPYPGMEIIAHKSNVTVASAGIDSSTVPFVTSGYRQMFILLRLKAATFGASSAMEVAVRGFVAAQSDSTAPGWWYRLGGGLEHGKTIYFVNPPSSTNGAFADRTWMIPLTDSLTFTAYQAPYTGVWLRNLTGAQIIYDAWYLGVR